MAIFLGSPNPKVTTFIDPYIRRLDCARILAKFLRAESADVLDIVMYDQTPLSHLINVADKLKPHVEFV